MKFLKNNLIAACFLTYGVLFGVLTENENLLLRAIENSDIKTFNKLLTPKKEQEDIKSHLWFLPWMDENIHENTGVNNNSGIGPVINDIDINMEMPGFSFLRIALINKQTFMIKNLIQKGLKCNTWDHLCDVMRYDQPHILENFLDNGADIDIKNYTDSLLHQALGFYHIQQLQNRAAEFDIIKTLLSNNTTLCRNRYEKTALDYAIQHNEAAVECAIKETINYKTNVLNNNAVDALAQAITNNGAKNSAFTLREWLILALHNKHHKQIWYCIKQKTIELEYVLALILLNKRLPVDFVNNLFLGKLTHKLYRKAQEQDHKKLGKALATIKRIKHDLTIKNTGNAHGKLPKEIVNNILSYL